MALNEDEKADLVAYLDGELDEAATQAVEAKIATDAEVRAELDALKQTWGLLDYLPKASASPNFTNRTMERLTLEKVGGPAGRTMVAPGRRFGWVATACWAAALVLAIGVGYFGATQFLSVTTTPEPIPDADRDLMRHLRVAEKWHLYENA